MLVLALVLAVANRSTAGPGPLVLACAALDIPNMSLGCVRRASSFVC
jgi:hypothetical protein